MVRVVEYSTDKKKTRKEGVQLDSERRPIIVLLFTVRRSLQHTPSRKRERKRIAQIQIGQIGLVLAKISQLQKSSLRVPPCSPQASLYISGCSQEAIGPRGTPSNSVVVGRLAVG